MNLGARLLPSEAGVLLGRESHAINLRPASALWFVCLHSSSVTSAEENEGGLCLLTDARPFPFLRMLNQATPHGIPGEVFYRLQVLLHRSPRPVEKPPFRQPAGVLRCESPEIIDPFPHWPIESMAQSTNGSIEPSHPQDGVPALVATVDSRFESTVGSPMRKAHGWKSSTRGCHYHCASRRRCCSRAGKQSGASSPFAGDTVSSWAQEPAPV